MALVLLTDGLTKTYKSVKIVDNVTINIEKGEICGLIGGNGAGKSTFFKMICGLVKPSGGTYELLGRKFESVKDEKEIRQVRAKVGCLINYPAVYEGLSAYRNLEIFDRYLTELRSDSNSELKSDPKERKAQLNALLELVGLRNAGKERVRGFSPGMKERLGIAQALVGDPEFLILDEPYNHLDEQEIIEIRELLLKLNKEKNVTILFSCHNLNQMALMARRFVFMDKGKIKKEISFEELTIECEQKEIDFENWYTQNYAAWRNQDEANE